MHNDYYGCCAAAAAVAVDASDVSDPPRPYMESCMGCSGCSYLILLSCDRSDTRCYASVERERVQCTRKHEKSINHLFQNKSPQRSNEKCKTHLIVISHERLHTLHSVAEIQRRISIFKGRITRAVVAVDALLAHVR